MITEKMYRYLGRNGTITSKILLEKIEPIPMFKLEAARGKVLTNGVIHTYSITVFEDELNDWKEIEEVGQD